MAEALRRKSLVINVSETAAVKIGDCWRKRTRAAGLRVFV
jgi:hypothetical protein